MIKLSGLFQYSMGGFLCLRGFASFKLLSDVSKPNSEIQRELIESHKGEMAEFLNKGEYRFFPEVILSLSLTDGKKDFDALEQFHSQLQSGMTWNKKIGDIDFDISKKQYKNVINTKYLSSMVDSLYVGQITFDETKHTIMRIDGNHRMSAAEDVELDFIVPYCLLLFRNPQENEHFSRAIFHNINAKQIPLNLEENLEVILESADVFTDEKLKTDPSFGWQFYLARKTVNVIEFSYFRNIESYISAQKYTFLSNFLSFYWIMEISKRMIMLLKQ